MKTIPKLIIFAVFAAAGSLALPSPQCARAQEILPPGQKSAEAPPNPAVVHLSLDEARQRVLSCNKSIILARLNIDEKRHATNAATKDYFPKIIGNSTYFHFDNPLGTVLTTRNGGTVNVNVLNQDTSLSTVMVAQPITKLIAVNALVQIARADECAAQAKLDQATGQLLSGVTQAYYGLVGAQRIEAALQLQQTVLDHQFEVTRVPQLRIALLEVRQGLAQVEGQVHELNDQLVDLLGLPPCSTLELADPLPPKPPVQCADQAAAIAVAISPEIREAAQNISKAEAAIKVANMAYLPDVNIIGGYANQTGASYIQENFNYFGITANYTLWEWGKKQDLVSQREATLALAHQNLVVTRNKVALEARKTYTAFDQAQAAYELAGELVKAYKDAERAPADQAGKFAAKGATAKAQLEYMKAEIGYRVAYAQLMGTIGR